MPEGTEASQLDCGPIRFAVEHRRLDGDGGPSLRVLRAADGRELLRFDCFDREPHWHSDPLARDEVRAMPRDADPVGWAIAELRANLPGYLGGASADVEAPRGADVEQALHATELSLRNPPLDLDALSPERLRLRLGEKWQQFGADALAAWVADMDFPVAHPIRRVIQRTLDVGDLGYPTNPKPNGLPRVYAERVRERFGWEIEPRQVEVIIDVVQGIFIGLETLCEPDDGVIVQPPIYPPFFAAVRETGRRLVSAPLAAGDAGYEIDFDALTAAARESRILLLSHPHNPSGRAFGRDELERMAQIALEHDLIVLSDEIHADLVYPPAVHIPFASLSPEIAARTVTLASATKAFNIAGLRCAVAHFGSPELKLGFLKLPRHSRGGANTLGMLATAAAWQHSQPWLDRVLRYLDANRHFLAEYLSEHLPEVGYAPPEATYLAWLDCRRLGLESPFRFFLEQAGVALSAGETFGPEGEGFVRLNFATSRGILTEILERMTKALRNARTQTGAGARA